MKKGDSPKRIPVINTLAVRIDEFLNHLVIEKGFSDNTLNAYGGDLAEFAGFLSEKGIGNDERGPQPPPSTSR